MKSAARVAVPLFAVAFGCYDSYADYGGGRDDATAEADSDVGDSATTCGGGYFDPATLLCWQDPPSADLFLWDDAVAYCADLSLGGHGDWHLPTIGELRSLVRGCSATETGGPCGVSDSCRDWSSCRNTACDGCSIGSGPGVLGRNWPPRLAGPVDWCWSSTSYVDGYTFAWYVNFDGGYLNAVDEYTSYYVRCVRRGS